MVKYLYHFLFIGLLLFSFSSFSQCPVSVGITAVPDATTIAVCKGDSVYLQINPSAGALTPTYTWTVSGNPAGNDTILSVYADNQTIQVIMYTTTGCAVDTAVVTINILTVNLLPTVTIDQSYCNPATADITITTNGGTAPYNYDLVGIGLSATGIYTNVPQGTYTLYITDSAGCMDTSQVTVTPIPVTITPTVTVDNSYCVPPEADITITSNGGLAPYVYNLVGIGTNATGVFTNVPSGSYTLYTTDANGCVDTNQVTIAPSPNNIQSSATPIITECNQPTADVQVSTTGGTPSYSYDLQGVGTSTDGLFSDVSAGSYTLITTDSQGCTDTVVLTIAPFTCPPPRPIEVMTPNEDGYNDLFIIAGIEFYPNNEVFIFDRWGQRVYHKNGYVNTIEEGFTAKYLGLNLPVSTYYYVIKVKLEKSEDIVLKGPLSVFR